MSGKKRKSSPEKYSDEKRTKTEKNFLQLDDLNFVEHDYQSAFENLANQLINHHELVVKQENIFRLSELEFYYYHVKRHPDTFAHRHPEQEYHSNWYFHRQGTSATASYKAGTYKGLDITFGSTHGESFGGILIRSIENKTTGEVSEGSCLVVDAILNICQCQTIKELVEVQMKSNLNVFDSNQSLYLRSIEQKSPKDLIGSPRVGLTLKVPSLDRERFLFRSYRFTPDDYFPSKMKMTIVLSLAAEYYFRDDKKEGKFKDYANELTTKTKSRSATVLTNLKDLQKGYEEDLEKKSSPLVDFYQKTLSTSDLAKAYGIWLKKYRSTTSSSV